MAAKVSPLKRTFHLNGHEFPDPNPSLTPQEALAQLGAAHPELNNSTLGSTKLVNTTLVYEIKPTFGNKG
jgi:PRTRC genetic system protein C